LASTEQKNLLTLSDVWIQYGRVAAVQGLSMTVDAGEFVGLIGNNGAGKTTTLRAITGTLRPTRGEITFDGQRIDGKSPDRILRHGVALVPENRRIFKRLSVAENLQIGTSGRKDRGKAKQDVKEMLERFPVLERYYNTPGANLSGGEQQQLAIARALLSRPKLLLLDEPTLGLAPLIVDQVFDLLEQLKDEGSTILLVEQNAARTVSVADRVYIMRAGGRVEFEGTGEQLAGRGGLQMAYMGL
jgi:branched-chain amino acid transport system ATP-binding protein